LRQRRCRCNALEEDPTSLFGKKLELDPPRAAPEPHNQNGGEPPAAVGAAAPGRPYVRVGDIIEDGPAKEKKLQQRIKTLKGEITDLERQIDARGREIGRLQSELSDTTRAKERLLMTQGSAESGPILSADVAAALEPLLATPVPPPPPGPPPLPRREAATAPTPPLPAKAGPPAAEERKWAAGRIASDPAMKGSWGSREHGDREPRQRVARRHCRSTSTLR
jgi:hypothetical protein